MGHILFLAHRVPFPPDRGDKIRSFNLLKALAGIAPVHLASFTENEADEAAVAGIAPFAVSHCIVRRSKPLSVAGAQALASGQPVSLTAFEHADLHNFVRNMCAANPISTIFVFSGQMGQYVPDDFAGQVIVDLCDVDSLKFDAYARTAKWPRAAIDRREARLLAAEELGLAGRADATLLVSEAEANLFRKRVPAELGASIHAIRNGIDADMFDPASVSEPSPFDGAQGPHAQGPHCVFTGQMDYLPNVLACERVIDHLLPALRSKYPGAMFHVVGRAPGERLLNRQKTGNGVKIWGAVPEIRPFIANADIVLAPLTIARGLQNKVLEAMAMARPVVLSQEAATGIEASDGTHFAVGADDAALFAQCSRLIENPVLAQEMGQAARRFVIAQQSWEAMLAPLKAMIGQNRSEILEAGQKSCGAGDASNAA